MTTDVLQPLKQFIDPSLLLRVGIVGSMTVGVKVIAFVKELVVARQFGTSDEIDAFLIALLIPTFIAFVAGDAFRDSAIPAHAELRARSEARAANLIRNTVWICGGVLLAASLITLACSQWLIELIARNFSPEKTARSRELLWLALPFGIAFGIARVLQGYLQANGRFAISSAAPVAIPATIIVLLFLAPDRQSADILAISTSLGAILFAMILVFAARRNRKVRVGGRLRWDQETRSVIRHAIPLLGGAVVLEGCFFIDTLMASSLAPGSVAVLSYGERICMIVMSIVGTAAGFALFPHVSDLAAQREWRPLARVTLRFSSLILAVSLPFVGFFWFLAEPVVRLLLERGEFTAADTARVADVLHFAGLQIPGHILAVLAAKVIMALRANRFLFLTTLLSLALNVGLNLLFIQIYGVKGIALSTAIVSAFSAALLFGYFALRIRRLSAE